MHSICSGKSKGITKMPYLSGKSLGTEYWQLCACIFLFSLLWGTAALRTQPSGGPYGPVQRMYELPAVQGSIYYVAPEGESGNSGETPDKPSTLEAVIARVKTADAIILRGGTYRTGNLVLNQGITLQPYKDERPVLKGTFVAGGWKDPGNGLWTIRWSHLFPSEPDDWWQRNREGKKTPLYRFNNDMVFADGKFLQAVGWEGEVDENTYYIDYNDSTVYIGIDPNTHLIEITAFNSALIRTTGKVHWKTSDRRGPVIRGITFTRYAYRALEIEGTFPEGPSAEANHGKEVIGTTLEDCTISYCSRVAGYFRGDSLTVRHCKISDTGTEGLYIMSSSDVLLEKNIFTRNNIERITGYYPAAVKIFNQCYRATCNDNLVIDLPYSNGIWYDVGNVDAVFTNNWVQGVGNIHSNFSVEQPWPSDNGFFFEISKGAVVAGNVFVNCDHGAWALNSSDVHFYNNTFVNSTACIARNGRSAQGDRFGWHASTGPDVDERDGHIFVNNLLVGDDDFERLLLYVWQPPELCGRLQNSQLKQLDYNMYVRNADTPGNAVMLWSPERTGNCRLTYTSLVEFRKSHPEFSAHSRYYSNYAGPLFKSPLLGNYQLLKGFPGSDRGTEMPAEIRMQPDQAEHYIGAYPLLPQGVGE